MSWPNIRWRRRYAPLCGGGWARPSIYLKTPCWPAPPPEFPSQFAEFWYVTFHALVWLDLSLSDVPEEEFAPPAPFAHGELDSVEELPEPPYTKEELRAYLVSTRQKCHTQLLRLSDEQTRGPVAYPGQRGSKSAFWNCSSTICATSRNTPPNWASFSDSAPSRMRTSTGWCARRMNLAVEAIEGESDTFFAQRGERDQRSPTCAAIAGHCISANPHILRC